VHLDPTGIFLAHDLKWRATNQLDLASMSKEVPWLMRLIKALQAGSVHIPRMMEMHSDFQPPCGAVLGRMSKMFWQACAGHWKVTGKLG